MATFPPFGHPTLLPASHTTQIPDQGRSDLQILSSLNNIPGNCKARHFALTHSTLLSLLEMSNYIRTSVRGRGDARKKWLEHFTLHFDSQIISNCLNPNFNRDLKKRIDFNLLSSLSNSSHIYLALATLKPSVVNACLIRPTYLSLYPKAICKLLAEKKNTRTLWSSTAFVLESKCHNRPTRNVLQSVLHACYATYAAKKKI